MRDKRLIMTVARPSGYRGIAILAAASFGISCCVVASPALSQSLGDRFKSLFGGKSEEPAQGAPPAAAPQTETDLSCPPVSIRAGASTYAVAAPGKQPIGNDLRYQATITRTARDCTRTGDQITARIGI